MNDHELLELAAKAAGYDKVFEPLGVCDLSGSWTKYVKNRQYINGREHLTYWNPLTDDGDALRLAVGLRFGIKDFAPHDNPELDDLPAFGMVEIWHECDDDPIYVEWYKPGDDRCAATRRAIVRAAAKIGKEIT